jgi:formamidopyrimidine-DNA glycosylase
MDCTYSAIKLVVCLNCRTSLFIGRWKTIADQTLEKWLASPFVLRSVDPPISAFRENALRNCGAVLNRHGFEGELFLIFHLMIAGRFQWKDQGAGIPGKIGLAGFDFSSEHCF